MVENDMEHGFTDGEGPFVTGAFQGEHPTDHEEPAAPVHGASVGEYPEIYNEWSSGELYEGPSSPVESEAYEGESPFLDEEEIVRDLEGGAAPGACSCRCAGCGGKRPAGARRRPVTPAHEYEDTGSGGRTTLSRGSRGQAVLELQSGLSKLGLNPGPIDGIFGAKTESAVSAFQQARGLTGTGVVDENTWAELDKALGSAAPSPSPGGGSGSPPGGAPGTSATAAAIVAEARKYLGFKEGANNDQPFSTHFGVRNVPWCAYFVSYVHTKVGIPLSLGSTVAMLAELKRRGRFFTTAPSPGDIVVFDWTPGDGKPAEHVGIVEGTTRDASGQTVVVTIEGNSSNSVKRNQHTLGNSRVVGYGRLWDAAGSGATAPSGGTTAGNGTAAALVAEAQRHIGFREGPNNDQPFSAHFGVRNVAWCAYFVSYVHTKVGIPLGIGSTDAMLAELRRRGRFFTTTPGPGDIVIFDWNPGDSDPAEHAGLVESVTRDASGQVTVNTIEGNSGNSVARRKYPFGSPKIVGYGRLWSSAGATSNTGSSGWGSGGVSTSAPTSGAAAPCAHAKPTTTTNPYVREFTEAAAKAGVPASWATDPALIQLVGHESGWKAGVKNPSSSAFGLFQFIKSTWKSHLPEVPYATPDPMWQAVGGYRYIKAAYRSPDRAWAFWQSTVCKNASLAPSDLQSRARTWISKGYAGY